MKKSITHKLKILPYLLVCFFSISCTKQPKCNDIELINEVVKIIKQDLDDRLRKDFEKKEFTENKYFSSFKPIIETRRKLIDELELKIHSIKTDDIKKEIRKCDCEGNISSIEKSNEIELISDDLKNTSVGDFRITGISPLIKYTGQITNEEKVYVTIHNLEEYELFKKNIYAKILYKIRLKYKELEAKEINYDVEQKIDNGNSVIQPNTVYNIYGTVSYPVFFYNSPNENDKRAACFTTYEQVYIERVYNNFGYINFTNSRNQTSSGWIRFQDLSIDER